MSAGNRFHTVYNTNGKMMLNNPGFVSCWLVAIG